MQKGEREVGKIKLQMKAEKKLEFDCFCCDNPYKC